MSYRPKSQADSNRIKKLAQYSKDKSYNIEGIQYNYLTAIKRELNQNKSTIWSFKCICGKVIKTRPGIIVRGKQRSCGCKNRAQYEEQYVGKKFGMLTAIKKTALYKEQLNRGTKQRRAIWLFECECGKTIEKVLSWVKNSLKKKWGASCGCVKQACLEDGVKRFYNQYLSSSKERNYVFNLNMEEFKNLIFKKCYYCNKLPQKRKFNYKTLKTNFSGIDRIDPDRGYSKDNCVPCCSKCNKMKGIMGYGEFKTQVSLINKLFKKRKELNVPSNGPVGDILLELELVLDKMCDQGLQLGDIHGLVHSHIWSHRQDAVEVYEKDNSRPILRYGHKDEV